MIIFELKEKRVKVDSKAIRLEKAESGINNCNGCGVELLFTL